MKDTIVTLGGNFNPPLVSSETVKDICRLIETKEFDLVVFNSMLLAAATYLEIHDIEYCDEGLPWAEEVESA